MSWSVLSNLYILSTVNISRHFSRLKYILNHKQYFPSFFSQVLGSARILKCSLAAHSAAFLTFSFACDMAFKAQQKSNIREVQITIFLNKTKKV